MQNSGHGSRFSGSKVRPVVLVPSSQRRHPTVAVELASARMHFTGQQRASVASCSYQSERAEGRRDERTRKERKEGGWRERRGRQGVPTCAGELLRPPQPQGIHPVQQSVKCRVPRELKRWVTVVYRSLHGAGVFPVWHESTA